MPETLKDADVMKYLKKVLTMINFWNKYQGIIVTLITLAALELLARISFRIPNPPPILMLAIILSAYMGGMKQGLISAAIVWCYTLYYFSISEQLFHYTDDSFRRIVTLTFVIPATAILVGTLKRRADQSDEIARDKALLEEEMTERKKAEEKLREGEGQLRAVLENAGDAIIGLRPPGLIFIWNNKAEEIYGYSRTEVIGGNYHELIVPERFRREVLNGLERFFQTGEGPVIGKTLSHTGLRRDGTEFPVELTVTALKAGGEWQSIGIVRDITERKRAEEALSKSEELLRTVLNNAPITIFAIDNQGMFTLSEGKSLEKVNLKPGENVGVSALELFGTLPVLLPNGETINGREVIRRVLAGETLTCITELSGVYFENQFVPYRDAQGKIMGMISVATIITERKRAEEELNKFREHLEDLVKERTAELEDKTAKLGRLNRLFVDRELRMKELKERMRVLEKQIEDEKLRSGRGKYMKTRSRSK